MRIRTRVLALLVALCGSAPLHAGAFGFNFHGGAAIAEAGAQVAGVADATAVATNPAALVHLDGLRLAGGLDFDVPRDKYASAAGGFTTNHEIEFPAFFFAASRRAGSRLAWGAGIDAPYWQITDWKPALFPARFLTHRQDTRLAEARLAGAYALDARWSAGAALRYVRGTLKRSVADVFPFPTPGLPGRQMEADVQARGTADGVGLDLGVDFRAARWGFGATLGAPIDLTADGDTRLAPATIDPAELRDFAARYPGGRGTVDFRLPASISAGAWLAPRPPLRLELDLSWARWSALDRTRMSAEIGGGLGTSDYSLRRDWNDTLAVRLGASWTLARIWTLRAGVALEPSPVPDRTIDPGFPRGDGRGLACGASADFGWVAFDLGYSYFAYGDRTVTGQEPDPAARSTYSSSAQVISASARWRF
jgi:long-chain fatty acid transport protein